MQGITDSLMIVNLFVKMYFFFLASQSGGEARHFQTDPLLTNLGDVMDSLRDFYVGQSKDPMQVFCIRIHLYIIIDHDKILLTRDNIFVTGNEA